MVKNRQIIPLVIIASLSVLALFLVSTRRQPPGPAKVQVDSQAAVTVEVTPILLTAGEPPKFNISFNTHSVDLDFNVTDIVSLTDDKGQIIGRPGWLGPPPGGHHRSGELDFGQPLSQDTRTVTLTLTNIAGVPDRVFAWNLP